MVSHTFDGSMNGQLRRAAAEAPMLDAATEKDYLARIRENDDPVAMRLLLASHLRLVVSIAQKYARHGVPLDDLVAEGNLGLVEAVRRFDHGRDTRFATYAAWWVRALVRRAALANRRIVGAPSTRNARRLLANLRTTQRRLHGELGVPPTAEQIAATLHVSVDDIAMVEAALGARDVSIGHREDGTGFELAANEASPEEALAEREASLLNRRLLDDALARLGRRERTIVERRWLDDDATTLAALGETMGISRERVRQLEHAACGELRSALEGRVA